MLNKIFRSTGVISVLTLFLASSCMKTDEKSYEAAEQASINEYLDSNPTLAFDQKESGLYYLSLVTGTGDLIGPNDTAYVRYTGKFLNGYLFDSIAAPRTYKIIMGSGAVIPGFEEAISYMREGGKSLSLLPSKLAYGRYGMQPYLPGYTPLLFEITLPKVGRAARK